MSFVKQKKLSEVNQNNSKARANDFKKRITLKRAVLSYQSSRFWRKTAFIRQRIELESVTNYGHMVL